MKSVFLSAGHSDSDPGACAFGLREADFAVEFRNMVSFYLQRAGVTHGLDGSGTQNLPLSQSVKFAKRYDIAVEFHCNASTNPDAGGSEALFAPGTLRLADSLSAAVATSLVIKDRGPKPENAGQHHRLAFVQAGGVILELFFITNQKDVDQYNRRKWVAAKAVADVLIEEANR